MSDEIGKSRPRPDDRNALPAGREHRNALADSLSGLPNEGTRAADGEHYTGSWRRAGQTRADGLVTGATDERPPTDKRAHPWTQGLHMEVRSLGTLISRDREFHRIVGHGGYANQVYGNRRVETGCEHSVCSRDRTVVIQSTPDLGSDVLPEVEFGRDRLDVSEDATVEFRTRLTMMTGTLRRRYLGGFIKAAAMEGVICGGSLVRTIGGPSASFSPLATSDVYGGAARVAIARMRFGLLHYRAAVATAWAALCYLRSTTFLIEPLVSVQKTGPRRNVAAKLARLSRVLGVARMVCPLVDIAAGIVGIVGALGYSLARLIRNRINGSPPTAGTSTVPRMCNTHAVINSKSFSFMQFN